MLNRHVALLLILLGSAVGDVAAQVVFTEDFEAFDPGAFPARQQYHAAEFVKAFPGWSTTDYWSPHPCSCEDLRNDLADHYNDCRGYVVEPHSGCTHIEMFYGSRHGSPSMETYGGSPYLTRRLDTLRVGELYELSTWIYLLPDEHVQPQRLDSMARHIGVQLFNRAVAPVPFGSLFVGSQLRLDTIRWGEWYQATWRFRPTCDLTYLAIGTFRNRAGPPTKGKNDRLYYYLDDISLRQLPATTQGLRAAVGVCRFADTLYTDALPDSSLQFAVYFASNSSELDRTAQLRLDAFASSIARKPWVTVNLTGFADRRRGNNQALSEQRIASVREYLGSQHRMQPFRFATRGFGDSRSTGDDFAAQRRVELRSYQANASEVPYRYALEQSWANQPAEAFRALRMWQATRRAGGKLRMLFDPRMAALHEHPGFSAFAKTLHAEYASYENPSLAWTLDSLYCEDQRYRTLSKQIENLAAWYPELDSTDARWDVHFEVDSAAFVAHDAKVLEHVLTLLEAHGWPGYTQVGYRAAKAAPLVLTHAGNTALARRYLPSMERACRAGEADWGYYALLLDRTLVNEGKPQRFGTQYRRVYDEQSQEARQEPYPVENPEGLELRRAEIGLY